MIANNKIDIFKKVSNNKKPKISEYIYFIVYSFIFIFFLINSLLNKTGWTQWGIGLAALLFAFSAYLQLSGKSIYKRYFLINDKNIKWQRTIFSSVNIQLSHINLINFKNSPIEFQLVDGNAKYFSLANIGIQQVDEIKELLYNVSIEKNIKYISTETFSLRK